MMRKGLQQLVEKKLYQDTLKLETQRIVKNKGDVEVGIIHLGNCKNIFMNAWDLGIHEVTQHQLSKMGNSQMKLQFR